MRVAPDSIRSMFLVALTTLSVGCVDNQLSFVIARFAALDPDSNCVADPGTQTNLNIGTLDVGITAEGYAGYMAAPIVENRLLNKASTITVETNNIQLTGVDVELQPSAGLAGAIPKSQRQFFVPAAGGFLAPAGGSAGIVVEVIPKQLALALSAVIQQGAAPERLVARIRPVGKHAGQNIDGGYSSLPIDICKFCLTPPPSPCPADGVLEKNLLLGSCYPAQDQKVTCCRQDTTLCGADVPVSTVP